MSGEPMKRCTVCGKWLPLENFWRDYKGTYGRKSRCKRCDGEQKRAKRLAKAGAE